MKLNILKVYIFILEDVNFSINLIQYERFKRERLAIGRGGNDDYYVNTRREKKEQLNEGFFQDIMYMLEYNKKGLLSLLIFTFHIYSLARQALKSYLYSYYPANRDPNTKQFVNPVLHLCEVFYLVDLINPHDKDGLINFFLLVTMLQFLILRLRSLFLKIKVAKVNRYRYRELSIVDLDFGYANEMRMNFREIFSSPYHLYKHQCHISETLKGSNRSFAFKFSEKMKSLERIDRYYLYNQIYFKSCFQSVPIHYLEEYPKKIEALKSNHRTQKEESKLNLLESIFTLNYPNRVSYISLPEYRFDPIHLMILHVLFLIAGLLMIIALILTSIFVTYIGLLDPVTNSLKWEKFSDSRFNVALYDQFALILIYIVNIFDNGKL